MSMCLPVCMQEGGLQLGFDLLLLPGKAEGGLQLLQSRERGGGGHQQFTPYTDDIFNSAKHLEDQSERPMTALID